MEGIILVGHGSPKKEANRMELIGRLLHGRMHPDCSSRCVRVSYLQYDSPTVMEAIDSAVKDGVTRLVIHPYFLSAGVHVTEDIPGIIKEAEALYPRVSFAYTEPLGVSEELVHVVMDRIKAAKGIATSKIESESFNAVSRELDFSDIPEEIRPIIKRVIHTTADFEFKNGMLLHPKAVKAGLSAVKGGKNILTDVRMIKAGINERALSRWGGKVVCEIGKTIPSEEKTRAETAIESALEDDGIGVVVIGNAPTALIKCVEMIQDGRARPDLVIGVPVGFVRAVESKALLAAQDFPYITNVGRKGGSTVAAAIMNALIKIAEEDNNG